MSVIIQALLHLFAGTVIVELHNLHQHRQKDLSALGTVQKPSDRMRPAMQVEFGIPWPRSGP